MRYLRCNNKAVSNVIGYIFSFAIASMVMVSALFVTNIVINDKAKSVAEIEAQSIANYVANAIAETISMEQAMPEASYSKTLDLPSEIAGKKYYIEITGNTVYVNTTDGAASKKSFNFSGADVDSDISPSKVYSDGGKVTVGYDQSEFEYKFDFGTGDITSHSPVESDYFHVSPPDDVIEWVDDFGLSNYPYRIPISIANPSSEILNNVPVEIVLNSSNFNYDYAIVSEEAEGGVTTTKSNLKFFDPDPYVPIDITARFVSPSPIDGTFYLYQIMGSVDKDMDDIDKDVVTIELTVGGATGATADYILFDDEHPIYFDGGLSSYNWAPCIDWTVTDQYTGVAKFYRSSILQNIPPYPEIPEDGSIFSVEIHGFFKDRRLSNDIESGSTPPVEFTASLNLKIVYGDIYVDGSYNIDGEFVGEDGAQNRYETKNNPYRTINYAISKAAQSDTIYVAKKQQPSPPLDPIGEYFEPITINKRINLVGEVESNGINDYNLLTTIRIAGQPVIKITSDQARVSCLRINVDTSSEDKTDGIQLDGCENVVVSNCEVTKTPGNGISLLNSANYNIIKDCDLYDLYGYGPYSSPCPSHGVEIDGSDHNLLSNLDIYDITGPGAAGIYIHNGADDNIVDNCKIHDSTGSDDLKGVLIYCENQANDVDTKANNIRNCRIYNYGVYNSNPDLCDDNVDAILIMTEAVLLNDGLARENIIDNCEIYDIYGGGIVLYCTDQNTVKNCHVYRTCEPEEESIGPYTGIWLFGSDYNVIQNCIVTKMNHNFYQQIIEVSEGYFWQTNGDAIHIDCDSDNNRIEDCRLSYNGGDGINIKNRKYNDESLTSNIITNCDIHRNKNGILFYMATDTVVEYCDIHENWEDGIYIQAFDDLFNPDTYNTIQYCNIYDNGLIDGWGVHLGPFAVKNQIINNNIYCNNGGVYLYAGAAAGLWSAAHNNIYYNNLIYNYGTVTIDEEDIYLDGADDTDRNDDFGTIPPQLNRYNFWDNQVGIGNYWLHCNEEGYVAFGWYNVPPFERINWDDNRDDHWPKGPNHDVETEKKPFRIPIFMHVYEDVYEPDEYQNWYKKESIQDAVDVITDETYGTDVGTVYIHEGTYEIDNPIIIDKSIRIIGETDEYGLPLATIKGPEDQPVFKITDWTLGVVLPTIYIENLTIDGQGASCGILVDAFAVFNSETTIAEIKNCDIYNTVNGIYSKMDNVKVSNCNIHDNTNGIYLDGISANEITDCGIYSNSADGIYLADGSDGNSISNTYLCTRVWGPSGYFWVDGNKNGIHLKGAGQTQGNTIDNCIIAASDECGILLEDSSKKNIITNCEIFSNDDAGIKIITNSDDNKIHHNYFSNEINVISAVNGNWWHDDVENIGNFWSDYTGNDANYDGIGEEHYTIDESTDEDEYPIGSNRIGESILDYSIEYWNPKGESIISLELKTLQAYEPGKYVYLYYSGDMITLEKGDTSLVFKDFEGTGGYKIIEKEGAPVGNEFTFDYQIPEPDDPPAIDDSHTKNERAYVIEARLKLNDRLQNPPYTLLTKNQANMIINSGSEDDSKRAYVLTVNADSTNPDAENKLYIHRKNLDSLPGEEIELDYEPTDLPDSIDHWITLRTYLYLSKNTYDSGPVRTSVSFADISGYVYEPTSMSKEGDITARDIEEGFPSTYDPYLSGYCGIGCGSLVRSGDLVIGDGSITLDWFRIRQVPVVAPIIKIGSIECNTGNVLWQSGTPDGADAGGTTPILRDYHYGSLSATFEIGVPSGQGGDYIVTITSGDYTSPRDKMTATITRNGVTTSYIVFDEADANEFVTKTVEVKNVPDGGFISIIFRPYDTSGPPGSTMWKVNAITLHKGQKGVYIGTR